MRWNAFAATLAADDYSRLVNLFTAGRGYVYIAARLAAANADAPAIVAQVDRALRAFAAVTDLLQHAGQAVPGTASLPAAPPRVPALPWQAFLHTRPAGAAPQLTAALADALDEAQGVAAVMTENGEVAALGRRLTASVERLQLLQHLCQFVLSR